MDGVRNSRPSSYTLVVPVKDEDEQTLKRIVQETRTLFKGSVELHIVDDGSKNPCLVSTIQHDVNMGYGAALKSGIQKAHGEWIVTMDGDGQHRLRDVERLIEFTKDFPEVDMVVGDRRLHEKSWQRYLGRKCLNSVASLFAWRFIPDLNSGLRIFRRNICKGYFPILSNGFSFTTSLTLSMMADNYRVDYLPIRVLQRKEGKSRVKLWKDGWKTLRLILIIGMALRTRKIREILRPLYGGLRKFLPRTRPVPTLA